MADLPVDYQDGTPPTGALTELPATGPRGVNAINARINAAYADRAKYSVTENGADRTGATGDLGALVTSMASTLHAAGGGNVQLERGWPPGSAEHVGQDVLTGPIEGVTLPPATQVVLAKPSDTENQTGDVSRGRAVSSHSQASRRGR